MLKEILYVIIYHIINRGDISLSNKRKNKRNKIPHHFRHVFFYKLLSPLVKIFLKIKFGYKFKKARNLPKNYIVLSNHTTDFDPVFLGVGFKKHMYFVASEHITQWKTPYKFLKFVFAPIVRHKGTIASTTVMEILRRTKRGANVCIFAEGVRSWDGTTGPILPSTAKLIKASGCGLVTYKLIGGYFVSPNWSEGKKTRRGHIEGAPVNVYTAEQLREMSESEIMNIINNDLYENAYLRQQENPKRYKGKGLAEKLENLIFICPHCNEHDSITSNGNTVGCSKCGTTFTYDEYGALSGIPYNSVYALSKWQESKIEKDVKDNKTYSSPHARVLELKDNFDRVEITEDSLSFNNKCLACGAKLKIPTDSITDMAVFGRHGIAFSTSDKNYEIFVDGNAYKYIQYFKAYKSKNN
jgi:1-acyl-sn-glycerol-3-phosphate acyltransferase